jgi:hypothetical protein
MSGRTSFTIAPARAGKSTFWRSWLKEPDPDGLNRVILCRDIFRLAYYNERFNASREPEMYERFDVAWKALHSTGDYHVGLDETHCSIKSIRNILRVDVESKPIFINTPIEVCKERAIATNQLDLIRYQVIDRMFGNLVTICNYRVAKCGMLYVGQYDAIKPEYIYQAVEKIRDEVKQEKESVAHA